MRIREWKKWGRFGGNTLSSVESGTDAKNQIELVLPIPCSLPCGQQSPGVRLPPPCSSKLCAICPGALLLPEGTPPSWEADAVLQLAGSRTLCSMVSMLSLPYWTLNWCWRARQHPWRTPGSGFFSLPWMLTGGVASRLSLQRHLLHIPPPHHHSTPAVYSRTESLLSVGYGGFFPFYKTTSLQMKI